MGKVIATHSKTNTQIFSSKMKKSCHPFSKQQYGLRLPWRMTKCLNLCTTEERVKKVTVPTQVISLVLLLTGSQPSYADCGSIHCGVLAHLAVFCHLRIKSKLDLQYMAACFGLITKIMYNFLNGTTKV